MQLFKFHIKLRFVRSKLVRRIIKAILFVLLFILFTTFLDLAFEFDERKTEEMLTSFSMQSELETVFVGSSVGEMLDADKYSLIGHDPAFNMCTPSQGLSVSLKNIKLAASQHEISKIVLLTTLEMFNSDDYDGIEHIYDRVVDSTSPFHKRIINMAKRNIDKSFSRKRINQEVSINLWIPWENETVQDFEIILSNLKYRWTRFLQCKPLGSDIKYDLNEPKYLNAPGALSTEDEAILQKDLDLLSDLSIPQEMLSEDKIIQLAEILTFCRDNKIKCVVIITPHRSDYYDRDDAFLTHYITISTYLDHFINKRGGIYYDAQDDVTVHQILPDEFFYDWEHIKDPYREQSTLYLLGVLDSLFKENEQ